MAKTKDHRRQEAEERNEQSRQRSLEERLHLAETRGHSMSREAKRLRKLLEAENKETSNDKDGISS